ncbi:MAG: hypothetical protein ETSY1_41025 [Candidatus Entotheonella factor]|uniref:Pectate lyase n=2 Tax=Candidatus Entotheonella TaxID=93171 RepID=W4L5R0_ENTF1|nr:MAG: hypothetical protein ETSY1_41025 [Candidatus Entotheonella factor]
MWPVKFGLIAVSGMMLLCLSCLMGLHDGYGGSFQAHAEVPAFPGAEGFGAFAAGGRGGAVLFVDNLNDAGPGSLRAAIEATGPRTVIFRVGGTIDLSSSLVVRSPYLTIAGQTAPGGGIALKRGTLRISTHDVIIRGLRVRPGDEQPGGTPPTRRDAMGLSADRPGQEVYNVIIDHCSLSWGVDETLATWTDQVRDVTVQWTIISESLYQSIHVDEGATEPAPHSMGAIFGRHAKRISFHHNLLAHNHDRNPLVSGVVGMEVMNNLVYNWKSGPARVSRDKNVVHWINNYFRLGPGYRGDISRRDTFRFSDTPHAESAYYLIGNVRHSVYADKPPVAEAEWNVVNGDTRPISGVPATPEQPRGRPGALLFTPSGVRVDTAVVARDRVLAHAGALHPQRDAVDRRIVRDVIDGEGSIIDRPEARMSPGDQRFDGDGYPILSRGIALADTDADGLPDAWEMARPYLNPHDAGDAQQDHDRDGYTNLEAYLHHFYPHLHRPSHRTGMQDP